MAATETRRLTARERRLAETLRWGLFWSSTRAMPGIQQVSFATLAEANAAARELFARVVAHYPGRARLVATNPFAGALYLRAGGEPIRVWSERVGFDDDYEEGPIIPTR